jgi:lysine 2,3-aminomutase
MSGLGIPTYVVDSPHGGGKIPMMPNYMVSASDDAVVLRNFEGMLIRYQAEDKSPTIKQTSTRGVSALLDGSKSALIPENNERMRRRELNVLNNEAHVEEGECASESGCGSENDHTPTFRIPLDLAEVGSLRESCNSGANGFASDLTPVLSNGESCHG